MLIIKRKIAIPELSGYVERRIYIYLPDSYITGDFKYPVMYMFDGQNIFFDDHATFGKSWGMKEYVETNHKQLIIVAIESNPIGNCRLEEYSPVDFSIPQIGYIKGRGEVYINWLTGTLKPYIDSQYRTLPDPANTIICGSSMGGLMALYGVCNYSHIFQKAACLSPSLWINPRELLHKLKFSNLTKESRIYMDYGSAELPNHPENINVLNDTRDLIKSTEADYLFKIIPGGTHNEASWGNQIPEFMDFLRL